MTNEISYVNLFYAIKYCKFGKVIDPKWIKIKKYEKTNNNQITMACFLIISCLSLYSRSEREEDANYC